MRLIPIKNNMNEVQLNGTTILFSYETPVACHIIGKGYIKTSKKWSATTSKHINQWLHMKNCKSAQKVNQSIIDNILELEIK